MHEETCSALRGGPCDCGADYPAFEDEHGCDCLYGLAPHRHDLSSGTFIGSTRVDPKEEWPPNFQEDPEVPGCGIYLCDNCLRMQGAPDAQVDR